MNSFEVIEQEEFQGTQNSSLTIRTEFNDVILNSIRIILLEHIPIYAIERKNISIDSRKNMIVNNDMIKATLSCLPLFGITSDNLEMDGEDNMNFEMFINYNNDNPEVFYLTTDNIEYYRDNQPVDNIYQNIEPIVLCALPPNSNLIIRMRASLGIGYNNAIFRSVGQAFNKGDGIFRIESSGQHSELELLEKTFQILILKLNKLREFINELKFEEIDSGEQIILILAGQDVCVYNILNYGLQEHTDIEYSGINQPDLLKEEYHIKFAFNTVNKPKNIINEIIESYIQLFS